MDRFRKDRRGAVTVLVTLLLIPALLITGTGVDLARLYTAQSIVQDGNQMAANAALSQYDAMLQDVYGLFAVASTDDDLNKMVSDYVNYCLYGDGALKSDSFLVFRGSEATATCTSHQDLGQAEVLKEQILQYAKFRAPVAIVDELMKRLDQFKKVKADSEVIEEKMELDDQVKDLDDIGEDLKKAIEDANCIEDLQKSCVDRINKILDEINRQLEQMEVLRADYVLMYESTDGFKEDKLNDLQIKYDITMRNIFSIADGGGNIHGWEEGYLDDDGDWIPAKKVLRKQLKDCLKDAAADVESKINDCVKALEKVKKECDKFEKKKADIRSAITQMEAKLASDEISKDVKDSIKADVEAYKALLTVDVRKLGEQFHDQNKILLQKFGQKLEPDKIVYGKVDEFNTPDPSFSKSIAQLNGLGRDADFDQEAPIAKDERDLGELTNLVILTKDDYYYCVHPDADQFHEISRDHYDFWEQLKQSGSADKSKSKNAKGNISSLLDAILDKLEGFEFRPQGAGYYGTDAGEEGDSGVSSDWTDTDKTLDQAGKAMDQVKSLGEIAAGVVDDVVDKLILVTYDSEMFSCYADGRTDEEGAKPRKSLAGIPVDTHVNYFYQSEMEFLYNGNMESAAANLAAVAGTMLLVRFVFNYISTFSVDEVRNTISMIRNACSFAGPIGTAVGIAVSELARVAFALGESVFDVADLRTGEAIPLLKKNDTWRLSISGLASEMTEKDGDMSLGINTKPQEDPMSLTYRDYLRIFLLLKDEATLVQRTGQLIELNVTNIKNKVYTAGTKIYGNEKQMDGKALLRMENCDTAYEVQTQVEMGFLFFSMGVFQKGVDGVVPPKTITVSATDRRGY